MDANLTLGEPRVFISRSALLHNVSVLRSALREGTKLCAVLKADGYGHCAALVADALCNFTSPRIEAPAVDALAVATIDESSQLGDVSVPVMVLRPVENVYVGRDRERIALLLLGEGQAYFEGELLPGGEALQRAGIAVPGLQARDGLATINGSNLITAMSALWLHDAARWLKQGEIAAAMSLEALCANMKPYTPKLHEARGFPGAVPSARAIGKVIADGDLATGKLKVKVQDAYSMRSTPQVIGSAHDALAWARAQVEIELNGVGDNPVFFPDENLQLSGANFQGTPVSLPMDMTGAAITMVSVMSERRMNRLNNPALSVGLPAFLTKGAGMFSGLMLSQYTADTLIVEQRILSAPASVQSKQSRSPGST